MTLARFNMVLHAYTHWQFAIFKYSLVVLRNKVIGFFLPPKEESVGEAIKHDARKLFYKKVAAYRGLAALLIVVYHVRLFGINIANNSSEVLVESGFISGVLRSLGLVAVVFFLILSGYVNFRPFAVSLFTGVPPLVKGFGFFIRRISKLFPIYWLSFFIYLVIIRYENIQLENLPSYFFLYHIFTDIDGMGFISGIYTSWALAIEFFYLIPITLISLLLGFKRVKLRTTGIFLFILFNFFIIIYSNISRWNVLESDPRSYKQWWPLEQWDKFAFGELLAILFVLLGIRASKVGTAKVGRGSAIIAGIKKRKNLIRFLVYTFDILLLLKFPIEDWLFTDKSSSYAFFSNFTVLPLALTMLVDATIYTSSKWYKAGVYQYLGRVSYQFFIFHPVALEFLAMYNKKALFGFEILNNWLVCLFFTLLMTIIFSWFSELVIVNPVNKYLKRFGSSAS